jgi:RNase P subunit RPR2
MNRIVISTSKSIARHDKFVHFFCVKCRDHFKTNDYNEVTFKNGKKALKTLCDCGTASYLIIKNQ